MPPARPMTFTALTRVSTVPSPSWPESLAPQHFTAPAVVVAQVWRNPAARSTSLSPSTATSLSRVVVLPSPTCPDAFRPQQLTPPPLARAQVWAFPAAMALRPLPSRVTATGAVRNWVLPSPSCPEVFRPQHRPPPSAVTAQVCSLPADKAIIVEAPTFDPASRGQGAAVGEARGNHTHATAQTDHIDRSRSHGGRTVTKLAELVVAPALCSATLGHRAAVLGSRVDRNEVGQHGCRIRRGKASDEPSSAAGEDPNTAKELD